MGTGSRRAIRPTAILVVAGWLATAGAAEWELGPTLGLMTGGGFDLVGVPGSSDFDSSPSFGITADYRLRPDGWIELAWVRQAGGFSAEGLSPRGGSFGLDIDHVHAGGVYRPPSTGVQPFVAFTAGVTRIAPHVPGAGDELALSAAVSGGGAFPLTGDWWLRIRGRGWLTFGSASFSGQCGGVGCAFRLSGDGVFQFEALAEVAVRFGRPTPRPPRSYP